MNVTITGMNTMPSCVDTIWLFDAVDASGDDIVVAVGHRPATGIYEELCRASHVEVEVEDWQIIKRKVAS